MDLHLDLGGLPYIGEILSVTAAVFWAGAVVLFKKTGEEIRPFDLNLFKTLVSFGFLVVTALIMRMDPFPGGLGPADWLLLAGSGFVGVAISDTLFLISLNKLGAGLTAVVDCLYSPSVIFLSFIFLEERIGFWGYVGGAMISAAILVGSAGGALPGTSRRDLITGMIFGVLGILGMGIAIVMTKEVLDKAPLFWSVVVRHGAGMLGLLVMAPFFPNSKKSAFAVFRPAPVWKFMIPASLLGNYFALIAWLGGMKYTLASVAGVLNQLSSILIFVMAAVFLKEPLTPRRIASVALAVAGGMLTAGRNMLP